MSDDQPLSRRRVLQGLGVGAVSALAGCEHDGGGTETPFGTETDVVTDNPGGGCPDVEYDLNTGFDQASGALISAGNPDDDWDVVADDMGGTVPRDATVVDDMYWPSPFQDSQWIAVEPVADQTVPASPSFYEYQYCFCLHEEFRKPELELQVKADDKVEDIRLNGTSLSYSGDGNFQDDPIEESITDPDLFQAGENCLTIEVRDTYRVVTGLNVVGTMRAKNADCECAKCDLSVEKYHDEPFQYGSIGTYTIEVCNDSEGRCERAAVVREELPPQLTIDSYSGTGWQMGSGSGGHPTFTHDNASGLAPGECLPPLKIHVEIPPMEEFEPTDIIENCVALQGNDADPDNDESCDPIRCLEGRRQFQGGVHDELANGTEPASPSQELAANIGTLRDFDETGANKHFGHTFDDLRPPLSGEICEATLVICVRPTGNDLSVNDRLNLGVWENSGRLNPSWSRHFGNYDGKPGLFDSSWHAGNWEYECLDFDLSALPNADGSTTNLLPLMNQEGRLDVHVQDDTIVDFVQLNVTYCCDDEPPGECNLTVTKDVEGEFHYGQTGQYVVQVCNEGDSTCERPIEIRDPLPDGMTYVGHGPADWSTTMNGGTLVAKHQNASGLAPGDCLTLTIEVEVATVEEWPGGSDGAQNCVTLYQGDEAVAEDCVRHAITRADDTRTPTEETATPVEQTEIQMDG